MINGFYVPTNDTATAFINKNELTPKSDFSELALE